MVNRLLTFLALAAGGAVSAGNACAQTAKFYVSSEGGDRLAAKPDVKFTDARPAGGATFTINDAVRFQKMDGFGASLMEAGIITSIRCRPRSRTRCCGRFSTRKRALASPQ